MEDRQEVTSRPRKNHLAGLPFQAYEGSYTHPAYGTLQVRVEGKNKLKLELYTGEITTLEWWQGNEFQMEGLEAAPSLPWNIRFQVTEDEATGLIFPDLGSFSKVKQGET